MKENRQKSINFLCLLVNVILQELILNFEIIKCFMEILAIWRILVTQNSVIQILKCLQN
jgi:hypothetical protein